jgi:Flp pilus assembly pilin Flp
MAKLFRTARQLKLDWQLLLDKRGQDMIEYALLAASIAVVIAGFLPPQIMPAVSTIFSKIISGFNAS